VAEIRPLQQSQDKYLSQDDTTARGLINLTEQAGIGADLWGAMSSYGQGIHDTKYDYNLPNEVSGDPSQWVANSNAFVLSVLNQVGVDVRTHIKGLPTPGANTYGTLLGGAGSDQIDASPNLTKGVTILGRDDRPDVITGTKFSDYIYGEQWANYSATKDTVSYQNETSPLSVIVSTGLNQGAPNAEVTVAQGKSNDELYGIEKIILSEQDDSAVIGRFIPRWLEEIDAKGQTEGGGAPAMTR
jgi:hypothetical protein